MLENFLPVVVSDVTKKIYDIKVQHVLYSIICILSIYLLRARNSYVFVPTWKHDAGKFSDQHFLIGLIKPVISDLDGDGKNEIVLLGKDLGLYVLALPDLIDNSLLSRSNIIPTLSIKFFVNISVATTDRTFGTVDPKNADSILPTILEAGSLIKSLANDSIQTRNQVLIFVTNTWHVLCYNHRLVLQWKSHLPLGKYQSHHFHVKSLAALVTSHPLNKGDTGAVIISGAFDYLLHSTGSSSSSTSYEHAQAGSEGPPHEGASGHIHSDWFSFALSGTDGKIRWQNVPNESSINGTIHSEHSSSHKHGHLNHKHHHWKIELEFGRLHSGLSHWSEYNADILAVMPHYWQSLEDSKIRLVDLKKSAPPKHINSQSKASPYSPIFDALGFGAAEPSLNFQSMPNAVISQSHAGLQISDLRTGRIITRLRNADKLDSLLADVDGDGALDRVRLKSDSDSKECWLEASTAHAGPRTIFSTRLCEPPSESQWFRASNDGGYDAIVDWRRPVAPPIVVPSVSKRSGFVNHILGRSLLVGSKLGLDTVVLASNGRLSSIGPSGEFNWQVFVKCQWSRRSESVVSKMWSTNTDFLGSQDEFFTQQFRPSLQRFSPIVNDRSQASTVLCTGWDSVVLVEARDGATLAHHSLPCHLLSAPTIGDFNNDGVNDIIVRCPRGYVGLAVIREFSNLYMLFITVFVIISTLLLSWCCKPDIVDSADDDSMSTTS